MISLTITIYDLKKLIAQEIIFNLFQRIVNGIILDIVLIKVWFPLITIKLTDEISSLTSLPFTLPYRGI